MLHDKDDLIRVLEYLRKQMLGEEETYTENGLNYIFGAIKDVVCACPEKIVNAVLEEVG